MIDRLRGEGKEVTQLNLKPSQTIRVKVGTLPSTYALRIDRMDAHNLYVTGVYLEELNYAVIMPQEKLQLYLFSDNFYYQADAFLKEKRNHPIYLWVLSRPAVMKQYKERRHAYRLDNVIETSFIADTDAVKMEKQAMTRNVSISGVAIVSEEDLPLHARVDLKVAHVGVIKGEVMWKYQRSDFNKWYYGIKYVTISEAQQNAISHYINERVGKLRWAGFV